MGWWNLKDVPSTASMRSAIYEVRRPDKLGKCEACKKYFWDAEERTLCNRSATSWGYVIVFYLAFLLAALAVFFASLFACIAVVRSITKDGYSLIDPKTINHPRHE